MRQANQTQSFHMNYKYGQKMSEAQKLHSLQEAKASLSQTKSKIETQNEKNKRIALEILNNQFRTNSSLGFNEQTLPGLENNKDFS